MPATTGFWLVKSEPSTYAFHDLLSEGHTVWDGVRNHQAKNNLAAMAPGHQVLVYHSMTEKAVVGVAQVASHPYPDPTDNPGGTWVVVDIVPVMTLPKPVPLTILKTDPVLCDLPLLRQSRLSVMPITQVAYHRILTLAECNEK
jgi:predicted RNA-binding protein with PUA-like domain